LILGLSMKEREQIAIFDRLKKGEISQMAAAKTLRMTARWVRKKMKRYLEYGDAGLVHLGRNRPSPKRWVEEERSFAMSLFEGSFAEFGPTLAAEKLKEIYNIKVSKEALRKAMIAEGYWVGKKRKMKHRARRDRKEYYGEMIQIDGSPHDWFEGRGPRCTLINFVDDATSSIPFMMLAPSESKESLMTGLRKYIEMHGIPQIVYVDYGGVFSVNVNNRERDKKTQFERACKELGITVKHASSPQAKGRVERSHGTQQDRLIKEMRLANISTIDQANEFILKTYLPRHNKRFSVPATKQGDIHRSADHFDLDKIFCLKDKRCLQNDFVISYKKRILQLAKHQKAVIRPGEDISVHEKFDGSLDLYIRGIRLNYMELKQRPTEQREAPMIIERVPRKPTANHPWRGKPKQDFLSTTNGGY
jgi:hypothetical protein